MARTKQRMVANTGGHEAYLAVTMSTVSCNGAARL